jgi:hypothetical protein
MQQFLVRSCDASSAVAVDRSRVLDLIGDGMSPRQAGVAVGVSERTGQDGIVIVEQV